MLEWERYQRLALFSRWKVPSQDREDLVQTIVLEMANAALRRDGQDTPDAYFKAIARYVVCDYWKERRRRPLSLNMPVRDTEGLELQETLAAPEVDWDAWLDAKTRLEDCPPGVKKIARKLWKGDPLTPGEEAYLHRFREDGRSNTISVWQWRRYQQHRAVGLCVTCGEKAEDGFARCARCRERFRAYQALYKRRKGLAWQARLRKHWRKDGRCPRCGRLPEPGRKKCPQCLAKDREDLRRWRERCRMKTGG